MADEQVTNVATPGNVVLTLGDNQGTIRDLATFDPATGVTSVANHRIFDSLGNLKSQTNAAVDCLFGLAGMPFDKASGTYRSYTRPYDPVTGRFLGKDWIDLNGGDTNEYRYCGNSPTNATDPTGRAIWFGWGTGFYIITNAGIEYQGTSAEEFWPPSKASTTQVRRSNR